MNVHHILKKLFTSFLFFVLAFFIISFIADFCYIGRNASSDPANPGWTGQPDFKVFWQAGKNFSQLIKTNKISEDYPIYDTKESFYHFRYSPVMALAVAPFGKISFTYISMLIWVLLSNLALFFAILIIKKQMSIKFSLKETTKYAILWGAFLGTLRYYLMIIGQGQTDAFVVLLLVLFLYFYTKEKDALCGIIFAVILQMKLFFLPALVYFLFRKKYKIIVSTCLSSVILLLIPALLIGFDNTLILTKHWISMMSSSVPSQLLNFKNQSLSYGAFSVIHKVASIPAKNTIYSISIFFTLTLYAVFSIIRKKVSPASKALAKYYDVSAIVLVSVLFSPISWEAYYASLVIPIALTIYLMMEETKKKWIYGFLGIYFVLSCIFGTDLTKFIPIVNTWRFTNISLGTLWLGSTLFYLVRKHSASQQ